MKPWHTAALFIGALAVLMGLCSPSRSPSAPSGTATSPEEAARRCHALCARSGALAVEIKYLPREGSRLDYECLCAFDVVDPE